MAGTKTIIHFFPRFYPYSWGGAEKYIYQLASHQQRQGFDVAVLTGFPELDARSGSSAQTLRLEHHSCLSYHFENIRVIGVKRNQSRWFDAPLYFTGFRPEPAHRDEWIRIWRAFFPEAAIVRLHVHSSERTFVVPHHITALQQLYPAVTIITHVHDPVPCIKHTLVCKDHSLCQRKATMVNCLPCMDRPAVVGGGLMAGPLQGLRRLLYDSVMLKTFLQNLRWHDGRTDRWVVYSRQMQEVLMRNRFKKPISIIKHGIDVPFLQAALVEKPAGRLNFAFVGRFVEAKGLLNLLAAWERLPETGRRRLFLVGGMDQTTPPKIQDRIHALQGRTDLVMLDRLEPAALAALLGTIHCVIIPSLYQEIGPFVLFEALAQKCNIIASDLGGMKEYAATHAASGIRLYPHHDGERLLHLIESFAYQPVAGPDFPSMEQHYQQLEAGL